MRTPLTRQLFRSSILAATGVVLGAATVVAQGMSPPEEAIAKLRSSYIEAYNAKDGAAIAKLYAEDGMLLTAEGTLLSGREAIATHFAQLPAWPHIVVTPGKVHVEGNMAWEIGTSAAHLTDAEGKMQTIAGHYLVVSRIEDGQWRVKALSVANDAPDMPMMKEKMEKPSKM